MVLITKRNALVHGTFVTKEYKSSTVHSRSLSRTTLLQRGYEGMSYKRTLDLFTFVFIAI